MKNRHIGSVFTNKHEILEAILKLHNNKQLQVDVDPTFGRGFFYKKLPKPKKVSDLKPLSPGIKKADATKLTHLGNKTATSYVLDPPFLFRKMSKTSHRLISDNYGINENWAKLQQLYKGMIAEANRILKKGGLLIFKSQDYTDYKTTMSHVYVHKWLEAGGFYIKDLAILNISNKIYNPHKQQRHFRKTHSYYFVAIKKRDICRCGAKVQVADEHRCLKCGNK